MKITVLDGHGTIGGNKIAIEENNETIFLDFGMNFQLYGKYFEEFISERARRGIYDLWMLNLIPRKNIYRRDLITDDLIEQVNSTEKMEINGVLITHAHLDHVGNIALLDERIPIIASPETLLILKSLADVSRGGMGMEIPFFRVREKNEYILTSGDYSQRPVYSTGKLNDDAEEFMETVHVRKKKIEAKGVKNFDDFATHFNIYPHRLDHSIPGSTGYIIEGDITVAYTGDFRMHGSLADESRDFIRKAKDARILITEGTRLEREEDINLSEKDVYENALELVENSRGLVVADFSARNFERLQTFKNIAAKTGRTLVVTAKDAYHLYSLDLYDRAGRLSELLIYDEKTSKENEWEKFLKEKLKNEWIDPFSIGREQEKFIVCFSFYDVNELLDIKPVNGSLYIYSSSEAFGEEDVFSFERLLNWLQHLGMDVKGIERVNGRIVFRKGLHASGHISQDELLNAIDTIDPDFIIPVHTRNNDWFRENYPEKLAEIDNGKFREF